MIELSNELLKVYDLIRHQLRRVNHNTIKGVVDELLELRDKCRTNEEREAAMEELAAEAQRLDLGY